MNTNLITINELDETVTEDTIETSPVDLAIMLKEHGTKSQVIRVLAAQGWKRGAIARFMGIKYQFVRNVLVAPVGKRRDLL